LGVLTGLDLPRNPSWSRIWESFGEDAYIKNGSSNDFRFEGDNVGPNMLHHV
jgi:beta-glucosidase